jgi:hypothetical protein
VAWRVWHEDAAGWRFICNRCHPLVVLNPDGSRVNTYSGVRTPSDDEGIVQLEHGDRQHGEHLTAEADSTTSAQWARCRTCGGEQWWRRPAAVGGGWVCQTCHPLPPGMVDDGRVNGSAQEVA